jgi:hypothetical protein
VLNISFGEMTSEALASAVEPEYCCWQKDFGTFRFCVFSCKNLQTLKQIYFVAVECCQQNCPLVSANSQVVWKVQEQFLKM